MLKNKICLLILLLGIPFYGFSIDSLFVQEFNNKLEEFLRIQQESPELICNENKNVFHFKSGMSMESILTDPWVQQFYSYTAPLDSDDFIYFTDRINSFNDNNINNIQHLLILVEFPEVALQTTLTTGLTNSGDVKDYLKSVKADDDYDVYNGFLKDLRDQAKDNFNHNGFTQPNKLVTFIGQYTYANKLESKRRWTYEFLHDGPTMENTYSSFLHFINNTYIGFSNLLWKYVDASIQYYEDIIPDNANCGTISGALTDPDAIVFVNNYCNTCGFDINYSSYLLNAGQFVQAFNDANVNPLPQAQKNILKDLVCNFQTQGLTDWEDYLISTFGDDPLGVYLGFTAWQLEPSIYDAMSSIQLKNSIISALEDLHDGVFEWYGWGDPDRPKMAFMLQTYYNNFGSTECQTLLDDILNNDVDSDGERECVKELWNLISSFWTGEETDALVLRVINKVARKAKNLPPDNFDPQLAIEKTLPEGKRKIIYWTLGEAHLSSLTNIDEEDRVEYDYEFSSNNYESIDFTISHCLYQHDYEITNYDEFGVQIGSTVYYTCGADSIFNYEEINPFDIVFVVDPSNVSFISTGIAKENIVPTTALAIAFTIEQDAEAQLKDNLVLAAEIVLAAATFGEAYALIRAGGAVYRIIGGMMIANQVLTGINPASIETGLINLGLAADKAAKVKTTFSIIKGLTALGDLASMSPSSINDLLTGTRYYFSATKAVNGTIDPNIVKVYDEALRMAKRTNLNLDAELAQNLKGFLGFTHDVSKLTPELSHILVTIKARFPSSNLINKINQMPEEQLIKFSNHLKFTDSNNPIPLWSRFENMPNNAGYTPDDILDTWTSLDNYLGPNATKHRSFEVLSTASNHLKSLPNGGIAVEDYLDVIKKYAGNCEGCTPPSPFTNMSWINVSEYLEAFYNLKNYDGITGINTLKNAFKNGAAPTQDGAFHVAKYLKENNIPSGNIEAFEGNLADNFGDIFDEAICSGCQFDIKYVDQTFIEFKSWKLDGTPPYSGLVNTITRVINGNTTKFFPQFLTYLQTGKFKYVFNTSPTKGQDINLIKAEFLRLFQSNKAEEIFTTNTIYFNSKGIDDFQELQGLTDINHQVFDFLIN